jgi:hypothetical protein
MKIHWIKFSHFFFQIYPQQRICILILVFYDIFDLSTKTVISFQCFSRSNLFREVSEHFIFNLKLKQLIEVCFVGNCIFKFIQICCPTSWSKNQMSVKLIWFWKQHFCLSNPFILSENRINYIPKEWLTACLTKKIILLKIWFSWFSNDFWDDSQMIFFESCVRAFECLYRALKNKFKASNLPISLYSSATLLSYRDINM